MLRLLTFFVVGLILSASLAFGAPARPIYEPPERVAPSPYFGLEGTTWVGRLYTEGERVTFHAGGTLTYGNPKSGSPGTWRFEGGQLHFDINKWSEYRVTVRGDIIEGNGWNKSGQKCQPFLRRAAPDVTTEKLP